MCGRYYFNPFQHLELEKVIKSFNQDSFKTDEIRPTDTCLVFIEDMNPILMKWGYTFGNKKIINARSETLMISKYFASKGKKRCVVVATGYFEMNHFKQKVYFHKDGPIYFAAIYNQDNEFSILTQEATSPFNKVHDRMPVVLTQTQAKDYLNNIPVFPCNDCEFELVVEQLQLFCNN